MMDNIFSHILVAIVLFICGVGVGKTWRVDDIRSDCEQVGGTRLLDKPYICYPAPPRVQS